MSGQAKACPTSCKQSGRWKIITRLREIASMNEQCLFRFACCVLFVVSPPLAEAQMVQAVGNPQPAPAGPQGFLNNYSKATSIFPNFWRPYIQQRIPLPVLENSPRPGSLIHDGKLELSLADAVALTLENRSEEHTSELQSLRHL